MTNAEKAAALLSHTTVERYTDEGGDPIFLVELAHVYATLAVADALIAPNSGKNLADIVAQAGDVQA